MKLTFKTPVLLALTALFMSLSMSSFAQDKEGDLLSKFKPGFYFDKQNEQVEGLIKYVISTSATGVEKIKAFKFKKDEASEPVKFTPETSNGFGITGSKRVYHTIYKNEKAKAKNKGGEFARVYIGGASVKERATIYYPTKEASTYLTQDSKKYLSTFIVRNNDVIKLTSISLVASKHKKVFKTFFGDCPSFEKGLAADKKYLNASNLRSIIKMINKDCK